MITYLSKGKRLRKERSQEVIDQLITNGWVINNPPMLIDIDEREVEWDNGQWVIAEKSSEAGKKITVRQLKIWLVDNNLINTVENYINALTGKAGKRAKIEFDHTVEFKRNSTFIATLGQVISYNDDQMDQLFEEASKI